MNRHSFLFLVISAYAVCSAPPSVLKGAVGERGNWVKKREWVKQAQIANEQLQKDVTAIQRSRKKFYTSFEMFEKSSHDFYQTKGFVAGKVDALIAELRDDVRTEKDLRIAIAKGKSEGDNMPVNYYDVQIEAIEDDVKRFEREIEQFRIDMHAIADVEASLSERLKVLDKHITESGQLGKKSADALDAMWWMIDDKKARASYYEIKGFADRAASIKKYIDGPLLSDFKKVGQTLTGQIGQVQKEIESIEQRGLLVEHRTQRLSRQKAERERLEQQLKDRVELEEVSDRPRRRKRKTTHSLFDTVLAPIQMMTAVIMTPFKYLVSFFVTTDRPAKKADDR